eukprot:5750335-Prymnesium_polylepis.1
MVERKFCLLADSRRVVGCCCLGRGCVRMVVVEVVPVAIVFSGLWSVVCDCECDVWWMVVVERWCARFATGFAAVSR